MGRKPGQPSNFKGKHHTETAKEVNRLAHLGNKHTEASKEKIRQATLKRPDFIYYWFGKTGDKAANWKGIRKERQERNDSAYHDWVVKVKKRDGNKCRINDENCSGYKIVHHILSWREFPELRYKTNNGITLCQHHHPRKRIDERRLIPILQGLVVG